jgi:AraC-like DNA-binding protein
MHAIDNFEQFRRDMREWHFSWEVRRRTQGRFRGDMACRRYDGVILAEFAFDAVQGARTGATIRHAEDDYVGLALIVDGGELYSDGRQEALTQARELLVWDAMRPATFRSGNGTRLLNLLFPRALVLQHVPNIDDLTCRKIGPETGGGVILASHVTAVHQMIDRVPAANRPSLFRATLEVLASCFHPDDEVRGRTGYRQAMLRRVEAHAREALFEPGFGLESVATHFRVSPRYRHRLFSSTGRSFSQWLRNERLARARRALASPAFAGESITGLALRFGFCDAAHFSRSFKAKYGCSPKRFRTASEEPMA